MATFSIGESGSQLALNTPRKIGKLDANTYPNGTLTFSNLQSGGAYWNHNSTNNEWFAVYLTNSTHTIWSDMLFEMNCQGNLQPNQLYVNKTVNVSFSNADIVGQDLYLIAYRWNGSSYNDLSSPAFRIMNYTGITIETSTWIENCSAPLTVTLTRDGIGGLKVQWNGAAANSHNQISGYEVYLSTTNGGSASSFSTTINTSATNGSYTFEVKNTTTYYAAVKTLSAKGASYNSGYTWSGAQSASWYTNCTPPNSVSYSSPANGILRVSWSGASSGSNNPITSYNVKIATSSGGTAVQTANTGNTNTYYDFTVNNTTKYYASVQTIGNVTNYDSNYFNATNYGQATYRTNCSPPTTVSVTRSGSTVTISWSGASGGTNNAISNYGIIRNSSQTEVGAVEISTNATGSSTTNSPGNGTFYYAVRTQGAAGEDFYSTWKWSSAITISGKPSVSGGSLITKTSMDALRTYLNKGTEVTIGNEITRTIAMTYKSTSITAGTTPVNASWYNN